MALKRKAGQTGFTLDPTNVVIELTPGTDAAAKLRVGDKVCEVDGLALEHTRFGEVADAQKPGHKLKVARIKPPKGGGTPTPSQSGGKKRPKSGGAGRIHFREVSLTKTSPCARTRSARAAHARRLAPRPPSPLPPVGCPLGWCARVCCARVCVTCARACVQPSASACSSTGTTTRTTSPRSDGSTEPPCPSSRRCHAGGSATRAHARHRATGPRARRTHKGAARARALQPCPCAGAAAEGRSSPPRRPPCACARRACAVPCRARARSAGRPGHGGRARGPAAGRRRARGERAERHEQLPGGGDDPHAARHHHLPRRGRARQGGRLHHVARAGHGALGSRQSAASGPWCCGAEWRHHARACAHPPARGRRRRRGEAAISSRAAAASGGRRGVARTRAPAHGVGRRTRGLYSHCGPRRASLY